MRAMPAAPTLTVATPFGRAKQVDEEVQTEGDAVEAIDVSAHELRRIPSKKWRELIKFTFKTRATGQSGRSTRSSCSLGVGGGALPLSAESWHSRGEGLRRFSGERAVAAL